MSDFSLEARGLRELGQSLAGRARALDAKLGETMRQQSDLLAQAVRDRMHALFDHPGRLLENLEQEVTLAEGRATVTLSVDLPQANILEFGGVTSPHEILPTSGKVLAFFMAGGPAKGKGGGSGMVFARAVHHPGSRFPERSYLRAALAQREPAFAEAVRARALSVLRGN